MKQQVQTSKNKKTSQSGLEYTDLLNV